MIETIQKELEILSNRLLELQHRQDCIGIYPHLRADGDAYGSSFALALLLRSLDIQAFCIFSEPVNEDFRYLPGLDYALSWSDLTNQEQEQFLDRQKYALMIDASEIYRLEHRQEAYLDAKTKFILDHHISEKENNKEIYIYPEAAASCELVFLLTKAFESTLQRNLLNHDIALCLYTGIITDTGNFSYTNVKAHTFAMASELMHYSIDLAKLTDRLFHQISWKRYQLESYLKTLTQRAMNHKISYLVVPDDALQRFGAKDNDLDALPSALRNIHGTTVSFLLKRTSDQTIKCSLRSIATIDIREFAASFAGGGHKNAAGFTLPAMDLDDAKNLVLEKLEEYLHGYKK